MQLDYQVLQFQNIVDEFIAHDNMSNSVETEFSTPKIQ